MINRLPHIEKNLLLSAGFDLRLKTDDRRVLESLIFPFFIGDHQCRRVLFVGCDWYTAAYPALFRGKEFWTIEINPSRQRYGASQHIADSVTNLRSHFPPATFDLIICNGVIGYGVDDAMLVEKTFEEMAYCLNPGGILIIGWNTLPGKILPEPADSAVLRQLSRFIFPPLGTSDYLTANPNRHTFSFFRK